MNKPSFTATRRHLSPSIAVAVLAAFLTLVLALSAQAQAATSRNFLTAFGPDGTFATTFSNPQSLAVDQSNGDLYVLDVGAGNVQRFDFTHAPKNFTAGPGSGTNALPGFSFDSPSAAQVAVDNSGGVTDGDIYVASLAGIDIYASDGTHLGSLIHAGGSGFGEACGVSVAPNGDVYVGDFGGTVDRYRPSGANPVNDTTDYDSQITGVSSPCNVAASNSKLYVSRWPDGDLKAYPTSIFPGSGGSAGASSATALDAASTAPYLDPSTGDVYVDEGPKVAHFDSAGTLRGRFGAAELLSSRGVAVVAGGGAYAADSSSQQVSAYGPAFVPVAQPTAAVGTVQHLSDTGARLTGWVNPNGWPVTDCHFSYSTDTSYSNVAPCSPQSPGEGDLPVEVKALVSGLQPDSTYHWRLTVVTSQGTDTATATPFTTLTEQNLGACPNTALRTGASANLPDCRAYEQVSPTQKSGGDVGVDTARTVAASDGNGVVFTSQTAFGDSRGTGAALEYMALRGPTDWATHSIMPAMAPYNSANNPQGADPRYPAEFSGDLSHGFFLSPVPLTNDPNTAGVPNVYLRPDLRTPGNGPSELLSSCPGCTSPLPPISGSNVPPVVDGASADFSHILVESEFRLTSDSNAFASGSADFAVPNLFESVNGALRLVGRVPSSGASCVDPDCVVPPEGSMGGRGTRKEGSHATPNVISRDGSRIIFTSPEQATAGQADMGQLYMRIDGHSTLKLNASERTSSLGDGIARYQNASADGSRVFFTDAVSLIDAVSADTGSPKLYMYDLNAPADHRLTVLDQGQPGSESDGVQGTLGTSDDGHYVYFAAQEHNLPLLRGAPTEELQNLTIYLWHDGALSRVGAWRNGEDKGLNLDVSDANAGKLSRVTPDGRHLLFSSTSGSGLTGADQSSACPVSNTCRQLYVYSADSNRLTCASCRPSGAPSTAEASNSARVISSLVTADFQVNHALSADGRYTFFSTAEKLVPEDQNGLIDAYEFDTQRGQVHLISSGTCACDSYFLEASSDGSDVFFSTAQRLLASDRDNNVDLYDARSGGGLASQSQLPPPPCTDTSSCQGSGSGAPGDPGSGSSGFSGPGNPVAGGAKPKPLTRAQKLSRALKACAKKPKRMRSSCVAHARKLYGPRKAAKKKGARSAAKPKCRNRAKHHTCKEIRRANTNRGGSK